MCVYKAQEYGVVVLWCVLYNLMGDDELGVMRGIGDRSDADIIGC